MAELEHEIARATVERSPEDPGTTLVRIEGELDLSSVPSVEAAIRPHLEPAPARVVFDLSLLTFMDSSGIAMLLRVAETIPATTISNPTSSVQMILEATGLSDIFHVES